MLETRGIRALLLMRIELSKVVERKTETISGAGLRDGYEINVLHSLLSFCFILFNPTRLCHSAAMYAKRKISGVLVEGEIRHFFES